MSEGIFGLGVRAIVHSPKGNEYSGYTIRIDIDGKDRGQDALAVYNAIRANGGRTAIGSQADPRDEIVADLVKAAKALLTSHRPGKGQCCEAADYALQAISKAELAARGDA